MTNRRAILILTALMPLLLGWIVLIGELNRALDRSAGVRAQLSAGQLQEEPFSGAMVELRGELLETRELSKDFAPGEDIFLRFAREHGEWVFKDARKRTDRQSWSATELDLPARIRINESLRTQRTAEPLLASRFSISRETAQKLHRETLLDLTLRRGAFGSVWFSEAFESALPLGSVVAIVPKAKDEVVAVGESTASVGPIYTPAGTRGWIAPIENGVIGDASEVDGKPLSAVAVNLTLAIAVEDRGRAINRFVVQYGPEPSTHEGTFLSFDSDGSFWSLRPDPFPTGRQQKLLKKNLAGAVLHEISLQEDFAGAAGDVFTTRVGYEVRRYTAGPSRLTLADSWTVEGLRDTCIATSSRLAAVGRDGAFLLTPGDKELKPIAGPSRGFVPETVSCERQGGVLLITRPEGPERYSSFPHRLFFLRADGSTSDLGEHVLAADYRARMTNASIILELEDRLYVARGSNILVFDLKTSSLLWKINNRKIDQKRRVF